MKNKFFILIFLAFLLSSCKPSEPQPQPLGSPTNPEYIRNDVERFTDEKAGVVCWVFTTRGGISCLPISQTRLGK